MTKSESIITEIGQIDDVPLLETLIERTRERIHSLKAENRERLITEFTEQAAKAGLDLNDFIGRPAKRGRPRRSANGAAHV